MVADIVDIPGLVLPVLFACKDAADVGLALGPGTKTCRVRKKGLQELDGHNLMALKQHRCGGQHAHILQTLHMGQIALAEGHEEADSLYAGDIFRQGLDLLMVQEIHVLFAHLVKVILPFNAHGRDLHPVSVLPVAARSGNLPEIDLRIEVGGKGIAVVAAVAVQDIDGLNLVELMLCGISTVSLGYARVKAAAEKSRETCLLKLLPVGPLPAVVKIGGKSLLLAALFIDGAPLRIIRILRLIVGRIHIIDTAGQAGVHDGQILIGQGDIHDQIRLIIIDQVNHLLHLVRIHLRRGNLCGSLLPELLRQRIALFLCPAGDTELRKHLAHLAALGDRHRSHTAASNH